MRCECKRPSLKKEPGKVETVPLYTWPQMIDFEDERRPWIRVELDYAFADALNHLEACVEAFYDQDTTTEMQLLRNLVRIAKKRLTALAEGLRANVGDITLHETRTDNDFESGEFIGATIDVSRIYRAGFFDPKFIYDPEAHAKRSQPKTEG